MKRQFHCLQQQYNHPEVGPGTNVAASESGLVAWSPVWWTAINDVSLFFFWRDFHGYLRTYTQCQWQQDKYQLKKAQFSVQMCVLFEAVASILIVLRTSLNLYGRRRTQGGGQRKDGKSEIRSEHSYLISSSSVPSLFRLVSFFESHVSTGFLNFVAEQFQGNRTFFSLIFCW